MIKILAAFISTLVILPSLLTNSSGSATETPVVVEILLVCDKDFSDRFGQDREKIIDFWAAQVWDLNMKFKTLSLIDISFQVTKLITIQSHLEQPFIEESKTYSSYAGTSVSMYSAVKKFSQWIYAREKIRTDFDIAMIVTGANVVEKTANFQVYAGYICQKDIKLKNHYSVAVLDSEFIFGQKCNVLEHAMARLLGSAWDSEAVNGPSCYGDNPYVMGSTLRGCNGTKQFFFSACSDMDIETKTAQSAASCLHTDTDGMEDALESGYKRMKQPSITDQCILMMKNREARPSENVTNPCISTTCIVPSGFSVTSTRKTLYPLDNSPCGNENFCFRGRCLKQSYTISNVATGKCLHSTDRFAFTDQINLETCRKVPTPLNQFRITDKKSPDSAKRTVFLATAYSTKSGEDNSDKCAYVDGDTGALRYNKCLWTQPDIFGWSLLPAHLPGEFLLRYNATLNCVRAEEDGSLSVNTTCDYDDTRMRWKFPDLAIISKEWLTRNTTEENFSVFDNTSSTTETTTISSTFFPVIFNKTEGYNNNNEQSGENISSSDILADELFEKNEKEWHVIEDTKIVEKVSARYWENWELFLTAVSAGLVFGVFLVLLLAYFLKRVGKPTPVENAENPIYSVHYSTESGTSGIR